MEVMLNALFSLETFSEYVQLLARQICPIFLMGSESQDSTAFVPCSMGPWAPWQPKSMIQAS